MIAALSEPSRGNDRMAASRGGSMGQSCMAMASHRATHAHLAAWQFEPQSKPFVNLKSEDRGRIRHSFRLTAVHCFLSSVVRHPAEARNSCGVVPVCFRKKRAKWEGSEKARS